MESEQHSVVLNVEKTTTSDRDDAVSHKGDSTSIDILKNLQDVSYIYRQDVVRKKTNDGVGVVTEVAGDTDSYTRMSDDEDEEEEDLKDDDAGFIKEGNNVEKIRSPGDNDNNNNNYKPTPLSEDQIRVLWMDESETIEGSNDVEIVDRGFLHGDYVASAHDPTGQMGVVVDVSINVDLLTHDGSILKEKPSKVLRRIRDFTVGDHVVLGPWLGRIEDVYDNVTVQLDDGSICKVMKADPLHLKPVEKNIMFPYYPGQRVKATSSSVFKNSRWLSGLWKANRLEGTVIKVTVGLVFVYWIASAGYSPDSATTPTEEQSPKNLKLLSCLAHTNWKLGDWCLLPSSHDLSCMPLNKALLKLDSETGDESDSEVNTVLTKNSLQPSLSMNGDTSDNNDTAGRSCNSSAPLHRKKIRKVVMRKDKKSRKKVRNFEHALLIVNTHTKVDVTWQDGTIKRGLDSKTLIPIHNPGDHEFISEQYVVEKAVDSDDFVENIRVGVVKSVNAKDRTACVRWLKHVARAEDLREFDKEEVVSVYELEGHLDYDYCYGDVVVRLSSVSLPEKMDSFVGSMKNPPLSSSDEHKNGSSFVHDEFAEFSDLSWVGNITGLKDGDIEVTWADGMISTVGPQAIYVVGRDDEEPIADGSDTSDVASWETVEDADRVDNAEEHELENAGDAISEINDNGILKEHSGKNGEPLSFPLSALGFMTNLASGIFYRGQQPSDGDDHQSNESTLDIDHDGGSSSEIPNDSENQVSNLVANCMEEEHEVAEASDLSEVVEALCKLKLSQSDASTIDGVISSFKGFDIVRDPIDHHFLGTHGQNNAARKWLKKVHHDWDILQNNLPEGIYVRVYEDRMDLLRAVIVGAYGTPYQDGLFFFDFLLPPEYPDVPPSAYYHSGGWRINPNLYEEGKVCLSLLNTWTGRGNEVWDPSTSSILQVLVSLQGLVLNSKPYFNEAGYDKQVGTAEGEKNSLSYNENTFLLNCKTMMLLIRKPPKDFEGLVIEHFRKRGYYILKACDAYMKGHLIGSLKNDAVISDGNTDSNSVGFKLMLSKLAPKLFSSLKAAGSNCGEFEHFNQMHL